LGKEYRSFSSSLCSFLHSPVTSSLLGPNTFLNTLFSNTLSLCSSLNVSDQVSHPYKHLMVLSFCIHLCSCTMTWWWSTQVKNSWCIINTCQQWVVWNWTALYITVLQKWGASYKDISLSVDINIWSSYDVGTYWILIWNLKSCEHLNWH